MGRTLKNAEKILHENRISLKVFFKNDWSSHAHTILHHRSFEGDPLQVRVLNTSHKRTSRFYIKVKWVQYVSIPLSNHYYHKLPLSNYLRIITSLLITQDTRKLKTLDLRLNIHGVTNWKNSRHEVDLMISPVFIHLSLLCPVIWHSDLKRTESGQASAVVKNCVGQDSQT